jgi:hypothetical protein
MYILIEELAIIIVNVYQLVLACIGAYYGFMALYTHYNTVNQIRKYFLFSRLIIPATYAALCFEWLLTKTEYCLNDPFMWIWNIFEIYVLIYFIFISRKVYNSGFYS